MHHFNNIKSHNKRHTRDQKHPQRLCHQVPPIIPIIPTPRRSPRSTFHYSPPSHNLNRRSGIREITSLKQSSQHLRSIRPIKYQHSRKPLYTHSTASFVTQGRTKSRTKTRVTQQLDEAKQGVNKLDFEGAKLSRYDKIEYDLKKRVEQSAHPEKQINPDPSIRVPPAHPDLDPSEEEHTEPILFDIPEPDHGPYSNLYKQPDDDFVLPAPPEPAPAPDLAYTPPTTRPPRLNVKETKMMERKLLGMGPYDEILIRRAHEPIKKLFHRFLVSYGAIPYPNRIEQGYDQKHMARDVVNGLIDAGYLLVEDVVAGAPYQNNNNNTNNSIGSNNNNPHSNQQQTPPHYQPQLSPPSPPLPPSPQSSQPLQQSHSTQPPEYMYPGLTTQQITNITNKISSSPPQQMLSRQHLQSNSRHGPNLTNPYQHTMEMGNDVDRIRARLMQRLGANQQALDPSLLQQQQQQPQQQQQQQQQQYSNPIPNPSLPHKQKGSVDSGINNNSQHHHPLLYNNKNIDYDQELYQKLGIKATRTLSPEFSQLNTQHSSIHEDNVYFDSNSQQYQKGSPGDKNNNIGNKAMVGKKMNVSAALGNVITSNKPKEEQKLLSSRQNQRPPFISKKYPYGLVKEDPILGNPTKYTMDQRIDALNARNLRISQRMLMDNLYSTLPSIDGLGLIEERYEGDDERELVPRMCIATPTDLYPLMVSVGLLPDHEQGELYTIVEEPVKSTSGGPLTTPQLRHVKLRPNPNYIPSPLPPNIPKSLIHKTTVPFANTDQVKFVTTDEIDKDNGHDLNKNTDTTTSPLSSSTPHFNSPTVVNLPYSKHDLISLCFYASGAIDFLKFITEYHQHGFFLENTQILPQHQLTAAYGRSLFVDDIPILPENLSLQVMPPAEYNVFHSDIPILREQWEMYHLRLPEKDQKRLFGRAPRETMASIPKPTISTTTKTTKTTTTTTTTTPKTMATTKLANVGSSDRFNKMETGNPNGHEINFDEEKNGDGDGDDDKSKTHKAIQSNLPHLLDLLKENLYITSTVADFKLSMPHLHHHVDQLFSFDVDPIRGKITFSRPFNLGFQSDFLSPLNPALEWRPNGNGKEQFKYSYIHKVRTHDPNDPFGELLLQKSNKNGQNGEDNQPTGLRPAPGSIAYQYDNYTNSNDKNPTFLVGSLKNPLENQSTLPIARPIRQFANKNVMEWRLDQNVTKLLTRYCNEMIPDELITAIPAMLTTSYTKRVHDSTYLGNLKKDCYFFPSGALVNNPIMARLSYDLAMANRKGNHSTDDRTGSTVDNNNKNTIDINEQQNEKDQSKSRWYSPSDYGTAKFGISPEIKQRQKQQEYERGQFNADLDDVFA